MLKQFGVGMLAKFNLGEYKSPEDTMQKIAEFIKTGVVSIRDDFKKPDDDWEPVYLVVLPDGEAKLFTSTMDKHLFVEFIAHVAKTSGAIGIGQLNSSWRKMTNEMPKGGSIAGKPGSEEGLLLTVYTRTFWQAEWAAIKRSESAPPTLAPWEVMFKREEGTEVAGAMFDPLLQALRKN